MKELTNLYQVKVRRHDGRGELIDVLFYKHFENAIADIMNKSVDIFDKAVPDSFYEEEQFPKMRCFSVGNTTDGDEVADDFEFIYENVDVFVYVGKIMTED